MKTWRTTSIRLPIPSMGWLESLRAKQLSDSPRPSSARRCAEPHQRGLSQESHGEPSSWVSRGLSDIARDDGSPTSASTARREVNMSLSATSMGFARVRRRRAIASSTSLGDGPAHADRATRRAWSGRGLRSGCSKRVTVPWRCCWRGDGTSAEVRRLASRGVVHRAVTPAKR